MVCFIFAFLFLDCCVWFYIDLAIFIYSSDTFNSCIFTPIHALAGTHLFVALNALSCGISLIATEVGPMSLTYLEDLYAVACPDIILPLVNKALAKAGGFPIPSLGPNLKLANVELTMPPNGGTIAVGADLQFVSTKSVQMAMTEKEESTTTMEKRPHCLGTMVAEMVTDVVNAMAASSALDQADVDEAEAMLDATVIA
jgi:hypothetical protein